MITYWVVRFLSKCILKVFYNFKIYGSENIIKKGSYIICTNHCSFFDPAVISCSVPRRVYWVALKDLYEIWPLSILLRLVGCIRVNGVIKEALDAINQGKIIGIFPEGRRTYDGKLMKKGRRGAAILAMRTGVPVLPMWIEGTFQAYPRRARFPKIHPISIHIGKPLQFEVRTESAISEDILDKATAQILGSISDIKDSYHKH